MVRHVHIDSLQEYVNTKFAYNSDNSLYFEGGSSEVSIGIPDVLYTDIAFIKPYGQIITHGRIYSCNALQFDDTPTANSINAVTSGGIKSYVDNSRRIYMGTCTTEGAVAVKEITIPNFPTVTDNGVVKPEIGDIIGVKFSNTDSDHEEQPLLKVNECAAFPLWYSNSEWTSTSANSDLFGLSNSYCYYVFDGTYWVWLQTGYFPAEHTYNLGLGYATCETAESTTAKTANLSNYNLTTGGFVAVYFKYAVPANSTLNINSRGAKDIYFRGAKITSNVIKEGDVATFVYSGNYKLLSVDRWHIDLASKQDIITGAATTVTSSNLTPSRALISNGDGKISVSGYGTTAVEVGYLHGVTSNIQTQLDAKQNTLTFDNTPTASSSNPVKSGGIKSYVDNSRRIYIGTCSSAGADTTKEITIDDFPTVTENSVVKPEIGSVIGVKYTDTDAAHTAQVKLKVNSCAEFPVWYSNAEVTSTAANGDVLGAAGRYTYYVFDGSYWVWLAKSHETYYSPQSLSIGYGTCSTAAATAAKVVSLSGYNLTANGIVSVKFTYDVPANSTMNINSKGAKDMYFRGSKITAGIIKAGDIATFIYTTAYHLIAVDRWHNDIASKQATITGAATTITSNNLTASKVLVSDSSGKVAASLTASSDLSKLHSQNTDTTILYDNTHKVNVTSDGTTVTGDLNVTGNLNVTGVETITDLQKVVSEQDNITLRHNASVPITTISGIKIENYDGDENNLVFGSDSNGVFRIGDESGTLEPLLTRDESSNLSDNDILKWDSTNQRAVGVTMDTTPTASSTKPVTSGGVKSALDSKQNKLTFDNTPTASSNNPVKSGGIDSAIKDSGRVFFGISNTAAATATKEFTIADFPTITVDGVKTPITGCIVTFTSTVADARTAQLKFKINDGGAFPINWNGSEWTNTSVFSTIFGIVGRYYTYVFNGSMWVWLGSGVDSNTTYTPQSLGIGYGTCSTAESTAAKVATLSGYSLVTNGIVSVKFSYNVPASATLNINSKGAKAIYYRGAAITANIIRSGDIATFIYNGSQYHLISIDRPNVSSVSGTLAVANGGTGATTAIAAEYNIIGGVETVDSGDLSDDRFVPIRNNTLSTSNGTFRWFKLVNLWNYIKSKITGAISGLLTSNLTASKALVSDSSGKVAVSSVTSTELGYVSGTTSSIQTQLNGKAASGHSHDNATTSAAGFMSSSDKTKLNGIATGAEVNQNAFSNITVGSTTIAADAKTDTLTLVAGSNVTLTPDATNDKVTIAATDTKYSTVSKTAAGLCPALPNETTTTKYLRQDGSWQVPPNTPYINNLASANEVTYMEFAQITNQGTGGSDSIFLLAGIGNFGKVLPLIIVTAQYRSNPKMTAVRLSGDVDSSLAIGYYASNDVMHLVIKRPIYENSGQRIYMMTSGYGMSTFQATLLSGEPTGFTTVNIVSYVSDISGKVNKSGDTMTGNLAIKGATVATNTYDDTNPKVMFQNVDASQCASLTFTDYDSVQSPSSLTLNGNLGHEYFIAPNIKATERLYPKAINQIITGSGTAGSDKGSGVSPRYFPAKWTFNTGLNVGNGDIYTIKIPVAGHDYGVFMSVNNGTNYYPIIIDGINRLTTHYAVSSYLMVIFEPDASAANMFPLNGGDARVTVTGGCFRVINYRDTNADIRPSAWCETAAGTAAKAASCSNYSANSKSYLHVLMRYSNTAQSALTLNVNGQGAKPIYINGSASSSSNYTLPAGSYIAYYNGTNYYFRTDGLLTADITGSACNVRSRGNITAESGTTVPSLSGISMQQAYNNSYPTNYGNVLTLKGTGSGQLLLGWSGTSGARASAYIRSKRDQSDANWSNWYEIIDSGNVSSYAADRTAITNITRSGTTFTATRADNTTFTFTQQDNNTTYSVVSKTANGLCPQLPNETTTTKYLRQDGTWVVPPNTTYSAATQSANGLMSAADKKKLDGVATGAEVNQNAFSNVKVGDTTVAADGKTDTLTLVAGSNVTLTPDATNDKITIAATNTTYSAATQSAAGLMSAADKTKLDGIATGAQVNTVTGVKGNAETDYRTGNVDITKANVGLGNVANALQVYDKANVSGVNMNTVAGYRNAMGMASLTGTDTTVNPNGQTSWHHFINLSYTEQSGSNMWQTQIANKAGTTDPWIRSRSGGAIADGTAWAAPWTRILTGTNWSNVVTKSALGIGNVTNYDQSKAIKSITRSGTTFTYTCLDNTTGTFTQQDNNTTYSTVSKTAAGLCPQLPNETTTTKYLRQDGTWVVPPDNNTTYSAGAGLALSGTTFKLRSCYAKDNTTDAASKPWHKFASITLNSGSSDKFISFIVYESITSANRGILQFRCRVNGSVSDNESATLAWLVKWGLDPSKVVWRYVKNSGSITYELWCSITQWHTTTFVVLDEGSGAGDDISTIFTLHNTTAGVASYTAGNGGGTSTLSGEVLKVNGHTVEKDVPSDAVFTDTKYNFSGVSFVSGDKDTASHDANTAIANGVYYYTSNGPDTSLGASTNDGALFVQRYNDSWIAQIAQDYRNGRLFVRGKNNGTWQAWKRVANYDELPTLGDNTFRVTRGLSVSTKSNGFWAAMCNSTQTGAPTLPTAGVWWHVISMDWMGNDATNWYSQLAIATQSGSGVWWRSNNSGGTNIDESTWHRLAEGDTDGNAKNALTVNGLTVQTAVPANAKFTDTNTWRGIQDNLTSSTNTTESLSAKQGYLLANGSARDNTKLPLSGGTIASGNYAPFSIQRNDTSNAAAIGFKHYSSGTTVETMGYIGMNTKDGSLLRWKGSSTDVAYTFLDSANSSVSLSGSTLTVKINGVEKSLTNTDNDTKNTAGSTDTSSKIFLVGATSQAANPQTYSHDTAYVGTDGCLYSGGAKVLTAHQDISGKVSKSGDTMTGVLKNSYNATTFVNGLTNAALTLTGTNYDSWICGPTKDGNISISTHPGGSNTLYIGYGEKGRTDNSFSHSITWGAAEGKLNLERLSISKSVNQLITGSGTAASDKGSGVSPRYFPAKWTFNTGFNATNGDIYTIKIPVAGHTHGVFMSVNNGTNYYPVVIGNGTSRITTHYPANTFIQVIFDSAGTANDMFALNGADARSNISGGVFRVVNFYDSNTDIRPSAYCDTAAATAAKVASCTNYNLLSKSYLHVVMVYANTSQTALTLNVNGKGAKPIYINGSASSASNYTLPAGTYIVYYNGTNYYFRTDGKLTADITGNAATVNGLTVQTAVPANAKFTDTTDLGSMTGTLPISKGGTGATTRLGALQALTNEKVSSNAQYFLTITTNWAKGGYTSVNDAKTVLGLGNKADLASPTFTGTPKAPTATAGTNTTQIATTAFVQSALSGKEDKLYVATGSGSVPGGGTWEAIRVGRLVTLTISGQSNASVTLTEELRPAITVYGATQGTSNLTSINTSGVVTCKGGVSTITYIAAS